MPSADENRELTSTLHLGLRSVVGNSPADLISELINQASAEERQIIDGVLSGDGNSAMVFIHRGPARGARFLITAEGSTIGRAPSNEIFLDDVTVSRAHATIKREGSEFIFTDSGSLNGSYINNQQATTHLLVTGDEIQIGKFHMLFISSNNQGRSK